MTLAVADFADLLRVANITFTLQWHQQRSLSGGGDTLYADRAPPLWRADITSPPMENAEAEGLMAKVNSLGGGLGTVLLRNNRLLYPSTDKDGSIFGAAEPEVGTITDRLHVAFTGFPSNYQIPLGTYFGVVFDTSRYYLGQFCEARTANGSGAIASVPVTPPLPAGVQTGNAVTVIKPAAKFRVIPGSAFLSSVSTVHATLALSAEQTYAK